jgi:superfamily II DNA or RNA helicase
MKHAEWQGLAEDYGGLLPPGARLRPFQVQIANVVLERSGDAIVVAPTGSGKSMLWHPIRRESRSLLHHTQP